MKQLLSILLIAVYALTALAGEKTVTISRNEGQFDEESKVYYATKDGIILTMTGGMNNVNYLLANPNTNFTILSYNYTITKIVFHCLDNAVEGDLDASHWGPSTITLFSNHTYPQNPGSYTSSGYTGTWVGRSASLNFAVKGRGVRFASIEITYEKLEGDVFDLVTQNSQIVEGKTYIIVSRYYDKVMRFKQTTDPTFMANNIVQWMNDDKTKVKVDGNAALFRMDALKDSTIGNYTRKVAWFNTLQGYIRGNGQNDYVTTNRSASDYGRAIMYISGTEYNYLCWFKNAGSSSKTIRYDYDNAQFMMKSISNDPNGRVWLFKQSESYNISTICTPPAGGSIALGDGVVDNTSQQYETVHFAVATNAGYKLKSVAVVDATGNEIACTRGDDDNYSFVMPDRNVTVNAVFEPAHTITTVCDPNGGGYFSNTSCNSATTDFTAGAQYFADDQIAFRVNTNWGYRINKVTLTDADNNVTTLAPTSVANDGNNYSFAMPEGNVTITAYLYESEPDLYLLGEANGGSWAPTGPKFNYNADTQTYYLDVYFKGSGSYGDGSGSAFNTFSLTRSVSDQTGDAGWNAIANDRIGYTSYVDGGQPIGHGESAALGKGYNYRDNAFKIPAGIYTIYVNHDMTQVSVTKHDPALTLDPAGGATAAEAAIVSSGAAVTLAGDLYSRIKAINANEADANFFYTTVVTVDGTDQAATVSATASTTATLDVVNEGETATLLQGANYLGWIVAAAQGYYQVIDTPLHWIEQFGQQGSTYTVSDRLLGVYNIGASLWCKDLGDISIVKTTPAAGQVDLLWTDNYTRRKNSEGWDQSNWVELDFSAAGTNGIAMAEAGLNHYIKAGTVTGQYTDDVNYKLAVTSGNLVVDGDATYEPNTYCTVNFLESNLTLSEGDAGPVSAADGKNYYLLNPKVQEYAVVTYAMWDSQNGNFVVPAQNGIENSHNFGGAFSIGDWAYNVRPADEVLEGLNDPANVDNVYQFHMIVKRQNKDYGTPAHAAKRGGQTPSPNVSVWPIDLQVDPTHIITAVADVRQAAQVAGVTYVNVAGVASSRPWAGVNIVVTRYTDGSTTTAKVIR